MYNISDGSLLANVDLPAYLSSSLADDDLISTSSSFSSSSFCLLQVSADLSTAVAVTQSNTAIAVDLNHYFRYNISFFFFLFTIFSSFFSFFVVGSLVLTATMKHTNASQNEETSSKCDGKV